MHSSKTIGLDGCRGGWAVATSENGVVSFSVIERLDGLDLTGVARIFIDIPVGLPETGQRTCDLKLREKLPSYLKSSVFQCPVRDAVFAPDYTEARRISIEKTGKSMSIQAWNICPKIREADRWLADHPEIALLVFESHPEWNWLQLNGLPVPSKHTSEGLAARLLLLKQRNIVASSRLATKNAHAKTDDLLDAAVLALSASLSLKTGLQNVSDGSPGIFTFA